jgi:hypothetical protein
MYINVKLIVIHSHLHLPWFVKDNSPFSLSLSLSLSSKGGKSIERENIVGWRKVGTTHLFSK